MLEFVSAVAFLAILNAKEGVAMAKGGAELFGHVCSSAAAIVKLADQSAGGNGIVEASDIGEIADGWIGHWNHEPSSAVDDVVRKSWKNLVFRVACISSVGNCHAAFCCATEINTIFERL